MRMETKVFTCENNAMSDIKGKLVINDRKWFKNPCVEVTDQSEIDEITKSLNTALDMYPRGAGLAANQLGYNKRMAIIIRDNGERMVLINPEVISRGSKFDTATEGCLSFPHMKVSVKRNWTITLKITPDSEPETFSDWEARVLQHELDHLNGKTMFDRSKINGGAKFTAPKKKRKKKRR